MFANQNGNSTATRPGEQAPSRRALIRGTAGAMALAAYSPEWTAPAFKGGCAELMAAALMRDVLAMEARS